MLGTARIIRPLSQDSWCQTPTPSRSGSYYARSPPIQHWRLAVHVGKQGAMTNRALNVTIPSDGKLSPPPTYYLGRLIMGPGTQVCSHFVLVYARLIRYLLFSLWSQACLLPLHR